MKNKRKLSISLIAFTVLASLSLVGCNDSSSNNTQKMPTQNVDVITIKPQALPIKIELPGRVTAYNIAEIRPQVNGIILKKEFTEGSTVTAGQSLYQIDPSTYQATYNSAMANLQSAKAAEKLNKLTLQRYQPLVKNKVVSQQDYDKTEAQYQQSVAATKVAEAAVESAKINLNYTKVLSPISGIIGKSSVTQGALVNANQTNTLATVQQINPIYVDITEPANQYLNIKQQEESGEISLPKTAGNVSLVLDNQNTYKYVGKIKFSDITVDQSTGSISLRAEFKNPDTALLPGMFVRAIVDEGVKQDAILVPQKAVTRDPKGNASVMVVNAKNQVEVQAITTSTTEGASWLVTSGLKSGDRVIVSGLQKIRPGETVTATDVSSKTSQNENTATPATDKAHSSAAPSPTKKD